MSWINLNNVHPLANIDVLTFINDFMSNKNEEECEIIRKQFMSGYCYYFAHILYKAFNRGEVCLCSPFNHFIWLDINGVPYDIEGVSICEYDMFIPEWYLGKIVLDFKHLNKLNNNTNYEELYNIIHSFKNLMKDKVNHYGIKDTYYLDNVIKTNR